MSDFEPESGPTWAERAQLPQLAAALDPYDHRGRKNALIDRAQKRALARALGDVRGRRVLDFGCGNGRLSRWLVGQRAKVDGVDTSEELLAQAAELVPEATFQRVDGFDLPVASGRIDVVLSVGVLLYYAHEASTYERLLSEFRRVLVPGGRVVALEQVHAGRLGRGAPVQDYLVGFKSAGFTNVAAEPVRLGCSRLLSTAQRWPGIHRLPFLPVLMAYEARRRADGPFADVDYADFLFCALSG